jgi:hypothetical protein
MRPARIMGFYTMSVRILIAVVVTASFGLLVAGCDGGDTTTTAAPTTTQAPGTTATSEPATTTAPPTTSAPSTTTPTTVASTTTSASGPTTTEQLSSAETRLPDGTIKGMGYIDTVWVKDGVRYLSIDYAEMLSGEEAKQAAIEDGLIKPGEDLDNDYYIRNQNPKKREFTVAAGVTIATQTREGGFDQPATWEEFLSFWGPKPAQDANHLKDMPWWIIRDGNQVIDISEQYIP